MTDPKNKPADSAAPNGKKKHVDELLDEALDETFPASDPPAMTEPAPAPPAKKKKE